MKAKARFPATGWLESWRESPAGDAASRGQVGLVSSIILGLAIIERSLKQLREFCRISVCFMQHLLMLRMVLYRSGRNETVVGAPINIGVPRLFIRTTTWTFWGLC